MTIKDTIRFNLLTYPLIFQNALDVYNHLFCVIGNGYKWENGELVPVCKEKYAKTKFSAILRQIKDFFKNKQSWKSIKYLGFFKTIKRNIKNTNKLIGRILDVDDNINDFSIPIGYYKFEFYPLCKYSAICSLPDDIKTDWLIAIKNMYDIMVKNLDIVKDRENYMTKIKKRLNDL